MRSFFIALVMILSLQSWVKADIFKFKIEGMSIGDSALNFFSEKDIKKNSRDHYRDKTFTPVQNDKYPFFKIYDAVDFNFRTGDKGYIFQSISGVLYFDKNIRDCYDKMDTLILDIKKKIKFTKHHSKQEFKHRSDKTGKSTFVETRFDLKNGYIGIICYDYSEEQGGQDHLSVYVDSKEFNEWAVGGVY